MAIGRYNRTFILLERSHFFGIVTLCVQSTSNQPEYRSNSCFQSLSFLLLFALCTLLLHTFTSRRFASQFLDFAETIAVGVALLACCFHGVDAGGFVGFGGDIPGF